MITASIVVYKEDENALQKTIESFLNTPLKKKLFLIDNSPKNNLENKFTHPEIEYTFVGRNIGFGSAHNLVLDKINSDFHLILNPDVTFSENVIVELIKKLSSEKNVSLIAPKVVYLNGKLQHTCRKYPTIIEFFCRKLGIFKTYTQKKEYRNLDLSKPLYPDFIHGCFLLFKTKDFKLINGFDKRYFLYMEDADICKKVDKTNRKKLYYPLEEITHLHRKGSSKSIKLFFYHLNSAIKYFLKWGI